MKCINYLRLSPSLRGHLRNQLKYSRAVSGESSVTLLKRSLTDPNSFWGAVSDDVKWFRKPDTVLNDSKAPYYRWFSGGLINTCFNCLDRHVDEGFGDQVAIIYDSPVSNTIRKITFNELLEEVKNFAGLLVESGVKTGDRVIIYMPNSAEAATAMLACARIGATHSVVFGGFAPHELATRIRDCTPVMIICSSCGIDASKVIDYKPLVDDAIELASDSHRVKKCIVYQREQRIATMIPGRDIDWAMALKNVKNPVTDCVPLDSSHPLYILYTSGTTGAPKGKNLSKIAPNSMTHMLVCIGFYSMNVDYSILLLSSYQVCPLLL